MMVSLLSSGAQTPGAAALRQPDWRQELPCPIGSVHLHTPIRAEGESGVLWNEGGGLWPDKAHPVIELIHRAHPETRFILRPIVPGGTFSLIGLPGGEYDFRAGETNGGWGCTSGTLVLSGRKSARVLRIEVPLGR